MIKILVVVFGIMLSSLIIGAGSESETKVVKETVRSVSIEPLKGLVAEDEGAF